MPSNYTEHYQLSQWERTDKILMEDFNADNARIDAALAAHDETLTAHGEAIALRGNCQIEVRTYTGQSTQENGTFRLSFPTRPALAVVMDGSNMRWITGTDVRPVFLGNYSSPLYRLEVSSPSFRWEGNTIVFTGSSPRQRLDEQGVLYCMVIFYPKDMEITSENT